MNILRGPPVVTEGPLEPWAGVSRGPRAPLQSKGWGKAIRWQVTFGAAALMGAEDLQADSLRKLLPSYPWTTPTPRACTA